MRKFNQTLYDKNIVKKFSSDFNKGLFDSENGTLLLSNVLSSMGIPVSKSALDLMLEDYGKKYKYKLSDIIKLNGSIGNIIKAYSKEENIFKTENTAVSLLSSYEAKTRTDSGGGSFVNVDGNPVFPSNKNTAASKVRDKIISNTEEFVYSYLKTPIHRYSKLFNDLLNPEHLKNFSMKVLDGKKNLNTDKSMSYTDLDSLSSYVMKINDYYNQGRKYGIFYSPTPSDRGVIYTYRLPKLSESVEEVFINGNLNKSSEFYKYINSVVLGEASRIEQTFKDVEVISSNNIRTNTNKFIKNYHFSKLDNQGNISKAGNAFYFNLFPELNSLIYDMCILSSM